MNPGSGEYIEVDGINTYYVKQGSGPPVVLLHGQPAGASVHVIWHRNIEPLAAAGFTVYAFDSVGFGRSDNDPSDFTRKRRARHARGFIDAMRLDRYAMWGMSDGSNLACLIALEDARVERMVLMASGSLSPRDPDVSAVVLRQQAAERASYTPSLENARAFLQRSLVDQSAITDELVAEVYAMSSGKNVEPFEARQREAWTPIYDELHRLKMPILMLWGANDSGGPKRGLLLFEKIPGAELHIFDRCGHWVEVDQAERVNVLVRDFLGNLSLDNDCKPAVIRAGWGEFFGRLDGA